MKDVKTAIAYLGVLFVAFTLPFSAKINSIAIILSSTPVAIGLLTDKPFRQQLWHNLKHNYVALAMAAFALFYAVSAAIHWSSYQDVDAMLKHLEMRLPFLLLPVAMAIVPGLQPQQIKRLWLAFLAGIFLSSIILLLTATYVTWTTGSWYNLHPRYNVPENNFMYHRLGSYLNLHAVYYSAMVALAFILSLVYPRHHFHKASLKGRLLMVLVPVYLLTLLFLLKSATLLMATLLIVVSYAMYHLFRARQQITRWQKIGAMLILLLIVAVIGQRILEKTGNPRHLFRYSFVEPGGGNWNVFNLRKAKWDVASEAIADYWLWGTGPANMQDILDDYYARNLFINALQHHYNPHNQLLQSFLTLGIAGGLIIFFIFAFSFWQAVKKHDVVWLLFLLAFGLFSITESTLEVNKGIVLFAFATSLFSYQPQRSGFYLQ